MENQSDYKDELSYKVQTGQFYYKGSVEDTLKGIEEAINTKGYDEEGVYTNVLRGVMQCNRIDILEKIYDKCINIEYIYEELQNIFLSSAFISKNEEMINFFIDKKLPFDSIKNDDSIKYALPYLSINLLDKIHNTVYDLKDKELYLLTRTFSMPGINEEKLDYLLSIGLKFDDDYRGTAYHSFSSWEEDNEKRINYLIKNNVDFTKNDNAFLKYAIHHGNPHLIDKVIEQKVSLKIEENQTIQVLSGIVRNDDGNLINHLVSKGVEFNMNNKDFLEYIASEKASKVLNELIDLGLNLETVENKTVKNKLVKLSQPATKKKTM